jgi:hypothetical protein
MTLGPGLLATIATMAIVGACHADAAELGITTIEQPALIRPAPRVHKFVRQFRVVRRRHFVIWKSVGMLCMLPPDAIVQLNWNGPQCRWEDNM